MQRMLRLVLLSWLCLGVVQAGEETKATLMRGMTAHKILENAYRFLEGQPAFSLDALTVNEESYQGKLVIEVRSHLRVDLDRRGKILVEVDGEGENRTSFLNGKRFIVWDRPMNLYGELEVPEGNDRALDYLYDRFGITTPLANLLYSDLRHRLLPKARGYYFGLRRLRGVRCHYIGFVNETKELEVWVRAEGDPLIERFVVIDKTTKLRLHSATDLQWLTLGKVQGHPFDLKLPASAQRIPIEPVK